MKTHETEELGRSFQNSLSTFISSNYHGSQEQKQKNLRELINMAFQENNLSFLIECYMVADGFVEEKKQILQLIEHGVFEDPTLGKYTLAEILPQHRLYEVLKNKNLIGLFEKKPRLRGFSRYLIY